MIRIPRAAFVLGLLLGFFFFLSARASDWPVWRGPGGQGVCSDSDLPLKWGGKDNENVLWKVPLPKSDVAQSSPVVWKDKIFVTTAVNKPLEQHLTCYKKS